MSSFPRQLIQLGSNECALGPSPHAINAAQRAAETMHRYPRSEINDLREAIAKRSGVEVDQVILSNGSAGVILAVASKVLSPGAEGVMARPTFYMHRWCVERIGARGIFIPTVDYQQDLEALLAAISDETRLLFITNPHSPTGQYVTHEQLSSFLARVPSHVTVILDEAYSEYADAADFPNGADFVADGYNVVVTRTFSKAFGLAAMRIGYGIGEAGRIRVLRDDQPQFHLGSLPVAAAAAAWEDRDHLERVIAVNAEARRYLYGALRALGLDVLPSQANFLLICDLDDPQGLAADLLERGIVVRPTEVEFGLPGGLRITTGTAGENERLIAELSELIR